MGKLFFIGATIVLPAGCLVGAIYKRNMRVFLFGVIAFVVSQVLIRLPLLQLMTHYSSTYQLWLVTKPMLMLLLLALSAGVMEELARWLLMRRVAKKWTVTQSIFFGLGHGGIEALLLVGLPVLMSNALAGTVFWLSGIERLFAMTIHVCLSVIVWIGVSKRQFRYVICTIVIHTAINFICAYIATNQSPVRAEYTLAVLTCILLCWTIQLGRGLRKHEKNARYDV